jgi:hypothetical protein
MSYVDLARLFRDLPKDELETAEALVPQIDASVLHTVGRTEAHAPLEGEASSSRSLKWLRPVGSDWREEAQCPP